MTRQAVYLKVTLRRFRVTIAVVEKQQVQHILCVCVCVYYVACKADCHMTPMVLPCFFHIINGTDFGGGKKY